MKEDVKNAFNSIERSFMLDRLYETKSLSNLWRLADWSYSDESPVYVQDRDGTLLEVIQCSQGVKQGCPLALTLFCVGFTPIIRDATKDHPSVVPIAIADDVTFAGPPDQVLEVSSVFNELLMPAGLVSRPDKKVFVSLNRDPVPEPVAKLLEEQKLTVETDGFVFAGIPIAASDATITRLLGPILDSVRELTALLVHPAMPKAVGFQILQQSANAKCINIARCLRPAFCILFAEDFDKLILNTFQGLLGMELSEPQIRQSTFPFSKGGLGLRPLASISLAAYVGAAAVVAPLWTPVLGGDWRSSCPHYVASVLEAVDALRPKLKPRDFAALFRPDQLDSFWDFFTSDEGLKLLDDA